MMMKSLFDARDEQPAIDLFGKLGWKTVGSVGNLRALVGSRRFTWISL
jgi:hypothetical protein